MFQTNSVAFRAERYLAAHVLEDGICVIESIDW
jgi:hypothetical protein